MRRERGFGLPGLPDLLVVLAIVAAVAGIVYAGKSYLDGIKEDAYQAGQRAALLAVAERDNRQLREAQAKLKAATDAIAAAQAKAAEDLAVQSKQYQREKRDAERTTATRLAAARDGALRLFDPGAVAPDCGAVGDRGGRAAAPAAAGGPDGAGADGLPGPAHAVLSVASTGFLLEITGEADDVASRLNRLQVAADGLRKACSP